MEYRLADADGSATMWTADPDTDADGDGSLEGDRPGFNAATEP
jgi:hypothetical protein